MAAALAESSLAHILDFFFLQDLVDSVLEGDPPPTPWDEALKLAGVPWSPDPRFSIDEAGEGEVQNRRSSGTSP
ncbi:MAG: hypothetical protein U5O39_00430 [Gammaproteobacteria bacterium]|nr:hypothetical protein [Gammaproteobacteria bacterium]